MRPLFFLLALLLATPARAQWEAITFPACTSSRCAPTDGFFAVPGWALAFDADRSYTGGGINGAFVVSSDGGATWTEHRYNFAAFSPIGPLLTYEAGMATARMQSDAGIGIHTSTDGQTWTLTGAPYVSGQPTYTDLARHGGALYARALAERQIERSTDLGQSWTNVTGTLSAQGSGVGLLLGSAGDYLLATTLDASTGVPSVWSTADGGTTWTRRADAFPSRGGSVLVAALDGGGLARVGAATLVAYTTTALIGGTFQTADLRRSADGGATFTTVELPPLADGSRSASVSSFAVVDDQTVFANTDAAVFLSRDAGATWALVDERTGSGSGNFVGTIHTDGRSLYFLKTGSFVERRPLTDFGVNAVASGGAPDPAAVALAAAPNPARGAVRLAVTLAEAGSARLTVYDALGRTVVAVWDGPLSAGPHALPLDVSGLAPGVYVARLATPAGTAHLCLTRVR